MPPDTPPNFARDSHRSQPGKWQPILESTLKDQAQESITAVLETLSARERDPDDDPSLAGGTAGLAILHGYLAQTEGRPDHLAEAVRCLQRATAAVADRPGPALLYGGLTGVGWALAHLQDRLPGLDSEEELTEID